MNFNCRDILIRDICVDDETYKISTNYDADKLKASISHIGLINPPILLPAEGGGYQIICGYGRIYACAGIGFKSIKARIWPRQTCAEKCVAVAINENTSQRDLNIVEKARALKLLKQVCPDEDNLLKNAGFVGLMVNRDLVKKLEPVTCMPRFLQDCLVRGTISLPVSLRLHEWQKKEDVSDLIVLLDELNLSLNKQRELISMIETLTVLKQQAISIIIKSKDIEQIRKDPNFDNRLKSQKIREYFKKACYPTISKYQKCIEFHLKKLPLPPNTQLKLPPFFESPVYSLNFNFKTLEEIISFHEKMRSVIESPHFQCVLEPFEG
ncbi:MAG: ParB N-terminal domain-containing protein [Desulfobacteraceae bacterium]|nr:ParB N-terminal domain-containing protein [Desulfobacteraceae bacterium]